MRDYSAFLIDLDGVVYRGNSLCRGAREFVLWLQENRKSFLFLTNSSAASQAQVSAKLAQLGIVTAADRVLGAGEAAVRNIARRFPGGSAYLVGEPAIHALLLQHGLRVVNGSSERADVVLCCLDRGFDYGKLAGAVSAVRGGAAFLAANRDPLLPVADGVLPGCGAIVAAIEASSGVQAETVGKPEPMLFTEAMALLDAAPEQTLMIGDNLGIDILGGRRAGADAALVLSGISTASQLEQAAVAPNHVFQDLAQLLDALRAVRGPQHSAPKLR
jgi:HAD superfamily hydrolase (TIGR01457 family)